LAFKPEGLGGAMLCRRRWSLFDFMAITWPIGCNEFKKLTPFKVIGLKRGNRGLGG